MMLKQVFRRISLRRFLERVISHPRIVILIIMAISALFAMQIPRLSFRTSVYDLVIEDLPDAKTHAAFKKIFGSDEIIRVVVRSGGVFEPAIFKELEDLAEAATGIPGVRRVISLPGIKKSVDPAGKWPLDKFSEVVAPIELFKRNILSENHKTTVLTLVLQDDADNEKVIRSVNGLIEQRKKGLSIYQIGMPLVSQTLAQLTERDFFRLPPLTILLIAGVLLLLFRNGHGLFLPLTCVIIALTWTFGLMAWSRIPLSMLTMVVPVFLIAVGTAYCLHIMSEYFDRSLDTASPSEVVARTYDHIGFPTILAVGTTIIGLGSLLINRIPTIREFAIFSCFGMFSLLVVVLTLLPALMCIIPLPKTTIGRNNRKRKWFDGVIDAIIHLNLNRQTIVFSSVAALMLFCGAGIFRIKVETNPLGYFKKDVPVKRHFHDIYKDLSGSFPINVVMNSREADYFEDPEHIADITRLQAFLETLPGVDKTVSFADYLKLVHFASNQFKPDKYRLPKEGWALRMALNNYRALLGEEMFNRFMTTDLSSANIMLLTHISSSREFLATREKIRSYVREHFSKDLAWEVTGFGIVISASSHLLTRGQIKSLALTMALVFGIMFLLFLSSKVGVIAATTNLFPIVVVFGTMGWLGIELSLFTGLVASIAIGLAVDDTIHYLVRFNREFRKNLNDREALRSTLKHVGRPILFTTLTISIGFSILLVSGFKATAVFGILMVVTMLSALVGDMVLLPSLMMHVELITLWDLVKLKLGTEPGHGIPLFQNMSRTEVHYICMAGALRQIDAGQTLFRKGEKSDSMYAVISGQLDVFDHAVDEKTGQPKGLTKHLSTLSAGDVVGEMGMLRAAPRSATIRAVVSGELLQINLKMIQRLQWLYPPTAHKFFFNLMTILCDRVEHISHCLYETSVVDDLTGLCNRQSLLACLEKETHRSHRYGSNLSLCLIRVGKRKDIDDVHGELHPEQLKRVTDVIFDQLRKSDTLGRMDERTFALVMPETASKKAEGIRRRLKESLVKKKILTPDNGLKIHFSTTSLNMEKGETGEAFFLRAAAQFDPLLKPSD